MVYTGLKSQGGHAVDNHFTAWSDPQPDEAGGNEFCGQYANGLWNDEVCEHAFNYLVEYTRCEMFLKTFFLASRCL